MDVCIIFRFNISVLLTLLESNYSAMPHCVLDHYRTTVIRLHVREIVIPVTQIVNIIKGKVKYMLIEIRINDQHQRKLKVTPLNKKTHLHTVAWLPRCHPHLT